MELGHAVNKKYTYFISSNNEGVIKLYFNELFNVWITVYQFPTRNKHNLGW